MKVTCEERGNNKIYSGLNKCAGVGGNSSTKNGLTGNKSYTVTDKAGNSTSCSKYNSSCSSCGTSYGSWGYFTSWSNYGCSETDTRDCESRTLYWHSHSC